MKHQTTVENPPRALFVGKAEGHTFYEQTKIFNEKPVKILMLGPAAEMRLGKMFPKEPSRSHRRGYSLKAGK